jgi:hypothetical protein
MTIKVNVDGVNRDATQKEIEHIESLRASWLAEQYKYNRASEYPDFKDYLDGIVKGDQAQVQAYIDACLAVKAKYPKG